VEAVVNVTPVTQQGDQFVLLGAPGLSDVGTAPDLTTAVFYDAPSDQIMPSSRLAAVNNRPATGLSLGEVRLSPGARDTFEMTKVSRKSDTD
jgi:hypothetical protein